jgi:hypothetical protein
MKKIIVFTLLTSLLLAACKKKEDTSPSITVMAPPPSTGSDTIGQGSFTSYDHGLSGAAILYKEGTPSVKKLRLYNYNMTAGPDVHVYLSKTASYSAPNILELTKLTTGYYTNNSSINLDVTTTSYTSDYKYVLVYCVQYSSLFGYVELK